MRKTPFSLASLLHHYLFLLLLLLPFHGSYGLTSDNGSLTTEEVRALNDISSMLKMKGSITRYDEKSCQKPDSTDITCDCSFKNKTTCHVTALEISGNQDYTGKISSSVVKLVYLERLDLSHNMLQGSIPTSLWNLSKLVYLDLSSNLLVGYLPDNLGTMPSLWYMDLRYNFLEGPIPPTLGLLSKLRYLYLNANHLTGTVPRELYNISNLWYMFLADNLLNGTLPKELGKLGQLTAMRLAGNKFTGILPPTFENLVELSSFSVRGNSFHGEINFVEKWKQLEYLDLIGNNFEGPLPTGLFKITSLKQLWVTDMRVTGNLSFPLLSELINLGSLILRNCSIVGNIPEYIGGMNLTDLDLSFNKLNGEIPKGLQKLSFLGLTRNNFQGPIPDWVSNVRSDEDMIMLDFSHNNFSSGLSSKLNNSYLNFFNCCTPSASTMNSPMQILTEKCPSKYSSLHIDCGGNGTFTNGNYYEGDNASLPFYVSPEKNWAYSISGDFISQSSGHQNYTKNTRCAISVSDAPLYATARISPLTLDYYGLCLHNGRYNVTLYFAEIYFSETTDHSILGLRVFDVVIQGETVLKDFSIKADERSLTKNFTANVTNNLLSIHMYWTGKGSIYIDPLVYGPLISAISAVPSVKHRKGLSRAHTALMVAVSVLLLLSLILLREFGFLRRKKKLLDKLEGVELQERAVTVQQVLDATKNFSHEFQIGGGESAIVYKANLLGGMHAVKKIKPKSTRETFLKFLNEIEILKDLKNDNLVELLWWYNGHGHHLLIYKYMENKSLYNALFEARLEFNWETRCKICRQIAEGLVFLQGLAEEKIIHGDIKTKNILLDENRDAKISGFGLARCYNDQVRTCFTTSYGTGEYMPLPPEYSRQGILSEKTDVYSYGILVLEIISGKQSVWNLSSGESRFLVDEAYILKNQGNLLHLIDRNYVNDYVEDEAYKLLQLAILCTNQTAQLRPTMLEVLDVLEGKPIKQLLATQQSNPTTYSVHCTSCGGSLSATVPALG